MRFSLLTYEGAAVAPGKFYFVNKDGELDKEVDGSYSRLNVKTVDTDLAGLLKLIKASTPNQHLTAGVCDKDGDILPTGNTEGLPSRSDAFFPHPVGPAMLVIDTDGAQSSPVWKQLVAACPTLAQYARIETSSTGSNLLTGDVSTGETGQHTYLHVADGSDIPRAMSVLHRRLILSGFAQYKVSKTGKILDRSAVDIQLRIPSQPIYLRPQLGDGVTQNKRIEFFKGEEVIDTRDIIPDLSVDEEHRFRQVDAEVRAALQDRANAIAADYDAARGEKMAGGTAAATAARQSGRLPDDWEVTLSDGSTVTVGAILAAPGIFHGMTCRDPMEPDYGSKTVAKIYSNQDLPQINTQAHGGTAYTLGVSDVSGMFSAVEQENDDGPRELLTSYVRVPFPLHCLPPIVAGAVYEIEHFVQAPTPLVVGSALSAMSTVTMGHVDAMRDGKLIGPSPLFLAEVGASGERKTACEKFFTKAIHDFEAQSRNDFKIAMKKHNHAMKIWEAKEAAAMKFFKDAVNSAGLEKGKLTDAPNDATSPEKAESNYYEFHATTRKPEPPKTRQMIYDAPTSEKLYQALGQNPLMGILADEAGSFLGSRSMSSESMVSTMAMINKGWDGNKLDKATKGDADECENPRVTMHLMMQPSILEGLLTGGDGKARDMGMIARFLLCNPESTRGTRFYRRSESTFALDLFNNRIAVLLQRPVILDEKTGTLITYPLPLSREAFDAWVHYHNKIESMLGDGGKYESMSDIASKNAENAARLACIFTYFDGDTNVSEATMINACAVAEWYLNETWFLLGMRAMPEVVQDATTIENWVVNHCIKERVDMVTLKNLNTYGPSVARKKNEVRCNLAINALINAKRLTVTPAARKSTILTPHPEIIADAKIKKGFVLQ